MDFSLGEGGGGGVVKGFWYPRAAESIERAPKVTNGELGPN